MFKNWNISKLITTTSEWVMRLSLLNLSWALLNIPLFIITFMIVISPNFESVWILSVFLTLSVVFLFFPSVIPVLITVRNWIVNQEMCFSFKDYFQEVKTNYKKALKLGSMLTLGWIIWGLDFYYLNQQHDLFTIVFAVLGIFLTVYTVNILLAYVHYDMSLKEQAKVALLLTFGKPLLSLCTLVLVGTGVYAAVNWIILIPFFAISLSSYGLFYAFHQVFTKLEYKSKAAREQNKLTQ